MPTASGPNGVLYNVAPPDGGLGTLFAPDNLGKILDLQGRTAFSDGLPTDASGNTDFGAMARSLIQKGDLANGSKLLELGINQQSIAAAQRGAATIGTFPGAAAAPSTPAAPSSADASSPSSFVTPTQGAMPMMLGALKSVESSGRYDIMGPVTKSGDRAYGAFQVMGSNVGPWTKEVLGTAMTPQQFLASPEAQDAVAAGKFGQSLRKYGNPQDAASVWFTGKPLAQGAGLSDQLGTTGSGYVSKFMAALPGSRQALAGAAPAPGPVPATPPDAPDAPGDLTVHLAASRNGQGLAAGGSPSPAPAASSDDSDADGPPNTAMGRHPYGGAPAASGGPMRLPTPVAVGPAPAPGAVGDVAARPVGTSAPVPQSPMPPPPLSPSAGAPASLADPTLGGQVPPAWLRSGHSPADWASYARQQAALFGTLPGGYGKANAEQWGKIADAVEGSIGKQIEPTTDQKNARDAATVLPYEAGLATVRADARAKAQADYALTPVQQPDGTVTLMPRSMAIAQAANGQGPVKSLPGYVTSGQQALATKLNDGTAAYQERQVAGERLDALGGLLSTFTTGANSQAFNDAVAKARSFGIAIPDSATTNPAAMQQFVKNGQANVLSSMREQGNRQFVSEVQSAIASNPNPDLQPEANAAIIAQMKGIQQYHDQNFRDFSDWYGGNKGAPNDAQFQIGWAKSHALQPFIDTARKDIAPLGIPIPPKNQLVDGQAYMVRGQKA